MTVPQIRVNGKKYKLGMWAIRVAYLISIAVLTYMSIGSHLEQRDKNHMLVQLGDIADDFDMLEASMVAISTKAKTFADRLEKQVQKTPHNSELAIADYANLNVRPSDVSENVDADIIPMRNALIYHQTRSQKLLDEVEKDWAGIEPELRERVLKTDRFKMGNSDFKFHHSALDTKRVSDTRTVKDMYWAAREIYSLVDNASTSNLYAAGEIRLEIERISAKQGELIEQVYFYNIIALAVILLGVFLPVDLMISRMIKRLAKERNRAAEESRKAAKADKAKSEFLANMSHEIRTPMNGVLGMAELLTKTDLDSQQRTYTDIVVKSGEALLTIINDVLDLSKIDAGHLSLEAKPFSFAEVVEDVAALEAARVGEKGLELSVRVDPHLPGEFIGDANRLRQIVTNLVGNAIKFTEKGQIEIALAAQILEASENRFSVTLKVKDSGIGIPEDELENIFDKFSQVDGSSTRKHEGTGLGLAIVSLLVKKMGGEISVNSKVDLGSEFEVTLPLEASQDRRVSLRVPDRLRGSRVVIADDNEVNRSILTEQLNGWGLDAASCNDGTELIAILKQIRKQQYDVDLIVLDYQMPGMDGAEVARILQKNEDLSEIPVIMLTSVDRMEDGSSFNALDIEAYLTKPARSANLLKTIVQVLEVSKTPDEEPDVVEENEPPEVIDRKIVFEPAPRENRSRKTQAKGDQIDILLAEDNEVNQIVFTQILKGLPYTFAFADNGKEAIEMYEELSPKMICMDISMPVMNGMEATRRIRSLEEETSKHTPIVAVTANAMIGHRESFLASGMDDYLSKPVSEKKFAAMIRKWMEESPIAKTG